MASWRLTYSDRPAPSAARRMREGILSALGLQAVSSAAIFLAKARNIPLGATIDGMNASRVSTGYTFLSVIWTASFETSLALAMPARLNRQQRRSKR